MTYSDKFRPYAGEILAKLEDAISDIARYYNLTQVRILALDDDFIGIPILLDVDIPSSGTVGDIDIRSQEPILIKLNLRSYPEVAPSVLSDRTDFPKTKLSHLYASKKDDPARLCLVRGDVHEWFASRRLENLLEVISSWFNKAATGKLTKDGNEFDPLRLDSYCGYHSYRYARLLEIIENNQSFLPDSSFACVVNTRYTHTGDTDNISFKSELPVQAAAIDVFTKLLKKIEANSTIKMNPGLTILTWHPENKIFDSYETEMPRIYSALLQFMKNYDVDIDGILQGLKKSKYLQAGFIPVVHAIRRPTKMIGFNGNYEFVNFAIEVKFNKNGSIDPFALVINQNHIEPFSSDLAKVLTGEDRNNSTLFIGAGSLGSKIIMHDARAGKKLIGICDGDHFLQHNLTRHSLFARSVGSYKSSELAREIRDMFETEPGKSIDAYPIPIVYLPDSILEKYTWIVDTTASQNVQNWIATKRFPRTLFIARGEIVHNGHLGLLYIEGENRNPRLDDLIYLAYFRATTNSDLRKWRQSDANNEPETLNIGLGCSSISTIMSDDTISYHAATFSKLLHNEKDRKSLGQRGLLFLTSITASGITQTKTDFELVAPFTQYQCKTGSGWEVRMMSGIEKRLLHLCKKYKPKETGGVLIGICNYKTKSIHVYDIIQAPKDSIGTPTSFIRGVAGLPERIDIIKGCTGGMIGYVGEWHTHPMQLESLSPTDRKTVEELIPINKSVPIPTLSLIVTNNDILPFVFP